MAYSDKVIEHYNNPRNVGALPKDDDNVGIALMRAQILTDLLDKPRRDVGRLVKDERADRRRHASVSQGFEPAT